MKKTIYLLIVLLIPFIFACSNEEDEESAPPVISGTAPVESTFIGQNNIAVLEGGAIGTGQNANSDLYKNIAIVLKNSNPYFTIGPAVIARSSVESTTSVKLILSVKNNTENLAFCDITTVGIALNDGLDQWIVTTISNNNVLGSMGIADSRYPASCLAAGRTGYMLQSISALDDSMLSLFEDVNQLEIDEIVYGSSSVIDPNISIIPQSYSVSDEGVSIAIKNTNQDYGYVWPGRSYVILLDYDSAVPDDSTTDTPGRPLYSPGTPFHYFVIDSSFSLPYQLRPGEDATMDSGPIDFLGASYKAIFLLGLGTDAWSSAYNIVE